MQADFGGLDRHPHGRSRSQPERGFGAGGGGGGLKPLDFVLDSEQLEAAYNANDLRIVEVTEQLERRLRYAESWLRRLQR